jgi:hypothetical protein
MAHEDARLREQRDAEVRQEYSAFMNVASATGKVAMTSLPPSSGGGGAGGAEAGAAVSWLNGLSGWNAASRLDG